MLSPAIQRKRAKEWDATRTLHEARALIEKWQAEDENVSEISETWHRPDPSLEHRLTKLEDLVQRLIAGIPKAVVATIIKAQQQLKTHNGLLHYGGIWHEKNKYISNTLVTHNGSLWIAEQDSKGDRPGSTKFWKLVNKSDESKLRKIVRQELEQK